MAAGARGGLELGRGLLLSMAAARLALLVRLSFQILWHCAAGAEGSWAQAAAEAAPTGRGSAGVLWVPPLKADDALLSLGDELRRTLDLSACSPPCWTASSIDAAAVPDGRGAISVPAMVPGDVHDDLMRAGVISWVIYPIVTLEKQLLSMIGNLVY